jgi:hypothetical protein
LSAFSIGLRYASPQTRTDLPADRLANVTTLC